MLVKLAALATLGYVGIKFIQSAGRTKAVKVSGLSDLRIAGGPLSEHATLQRSADVPPAIPEY